MILAKLMLAPFYFLIISSSTSSNGAKNALRPQYDIRKCSAVAKSKLLHTKQHLLFKPETGSTICCLCQSRRAKTEFRSREAVNDTSPNEHTNLADFWKRVADTKS